VRQSAQANQRCTMSFTAEELLIGEVRSVVQTPVRNHITMSTCVGPGRCWVQPGSLVHGRQHYGRPAPPSQVRCSPAKIQHSRLSEATPSQAITKQALPPGAPRRAGCAGMEAGCGPVRDRPQAGHHPQSSQLLMDGEYLRITLPHVCSPDRHGSNRCARPRKSSTSPRTRCRGTTRRSKCSTRSTSMTTRRSVTCWLAKVRGRHAWHTPPGAV
jgi:hypothetical protein